MSKNIYLGKIERSSFFGKKWKPLNLPWQFMRSHGIIKAENGANWFNVASNMIDSVLKQNGRVLIIDRREIKPDYETINFTDLKFGDVSTNILTNLDNQLFFHNFINARSKFPEDKRLTYIPQFVAFKECEKNTSLIAHRIREALSMSFSTPINTQKEDLSSEQSFWEKSPPVFILTLGKPWYSDQITIAAQLRAISVSSYHIFLSMDDLNSNIDVNSVFKMFLFRNNKNSNSSKKNITDGFVHFTEQDPKMMWENKSLNCLFEA